MPDTIDIRTLPVGLYQKGERDHKRVRRIDTRDQIGSPYFIKNLSSNSPTDFTPWPAYSDHGGHGLYASGHFAKDDDNKPINRGKDNNTVLISGMKYCSGLILAWGDHEGLGDYFAVHLTSSVEKLLDFGNIIRPWIEKTRKNQIYETPYAFAAIGSDSSSQAEADKFHKHILDIMRLCPGTKKKPDTTVYTQASCLMVDRLRHVALSSATNLFAFANGSKLLPDQA